MALTECRDTEYETVAPTANTNRICATITTCTADQYEVCMRVRACVFVLCKGVMRGGGIIRVCVCMSARARARVCVYFT